MICPTSGRFPGHAHLLSECVESFLRQDYPDKELVILNDERRQHLVCDAPGVRVVNVTERSPSLGEKFDALVRLASYDLIAVQEDDDVSLPWRLSQAAERLAGGAGYFNPRRSWFLAYADAGGGTGPGLYRTHRQGVNHNASAFTRDAWARAGGYPHTSGDQDAGMDRRLAAAVPCAEPLTDDASGWSYLYRWGVGFHLSGTADHEAAYRAYGGRPVEAGVFRIVPGWREDYVAMTRAALGGD